MTSDGWMGEGERRREGGEVTGGGREMGREKGIRTCLVSERGAIRKAVNRLKSRF